MFCPYCEHLHIIYKICVNRQCLVISLLPSSLLVALACFPFVDKFDCEFTFSWPGVWKGILRLGEIKNFNDVRV